MTQSGARPSLENQQIDGIAVVIRNSRNQSQSAVLHQCTARRPFRIIGHLGDHAPRPARKQLRNRCLAERRPNTAPPGAGGHRDVVQPASADGARDLAKEHTAHDSIVVLGDKHTRFGVADVERAAKKVGGRVGVGAARYRVSEERRDRGPVLRYRRSNRSGHGWGAARHAITRPAVQARSCPIQLDLPDLVHFRQPA